MARAGAVALVRGRRAREPAYDRGRGHRASALRGRAGGGRAGPGGPARRRDREDRGGRGGCGRPDPFAAHRGVLAGLALPAHPGRARALAGAEPPHRAYGVVRGRRLRAARRVVRRFRTAAQRLDAGSRLRVLGARGGHRGRRGLSVRAARATSSAPDDRPGGADAARVARRAAAGRAVGSGAPPSRRRRGARTQSASGDRGLRWGRVADPCSTPRRASPPPSTRSRMSRWTGWSSVGWRRGMCRRRKRRRVRWATARPSETYSSPPRP